MSEQTRVGGSVEVKQSSEASVVLELMKHIANYEDKSKEEKKDRNYWLTLYYQCRKATKDSAKLDYVLKVNND
ncbi:MAG TPA: hypothetical protein PKG49_02215 [Nitrosomonas mobilis]|nr:hypothetical protein [Nitrosomonas mobilis]